ncbi:MAG: hypothetical protein ABSF60_04210 [Verrucomicrobiota bacterium]
MRFIRIGASTIVLREQFPELFRDGRKNPSTARPHPAIEQLIAGDRGLRTAMLEMFLKELNVRAQWPA